MQTAAATQNLMRAGTDKLRTQSDTDLRAFSSALRCRMRGSWAKASFTNCFMRRASSFLAGSRSLLLYLSIHLQAKYTGSQTHFRYNC